MGKETNYAFIDGQNLYQGIAEQGWKLDYARFGVYLKEKYKVVRAYLFLGYMPEHQLLYADLRRKGYVLKFKPVLDFAGYPKQGNVDADLVLNVMKYYFEYSGAVIVTSDGDFDTTVKYLEKKGKFTVVLSPAQKKCSALLKKAAKDKIDFFENFKSKVELVLEVKNEKAPL